MLLSHHLRTSNGSKLRVLMCCEIVAHLMLNNYELILEISEILDYLMGLLNV